MVERMVKNNMKRSRHLVICEGFTECWYLEEVLDPKLVKVEKSKHSNAEQLVNGANNRQDQVPPENKIYCVFDHDNQSNPDKQLLAANKCIKNSEDKLQRIFSKPCFEIALLFNFTATSKIFADCTQVEIALNKQLKEKYVKKDKCIKSLSKKVEFSQICKNSKVIYDQLSINDDNWLAIEDGYSEIFKLNDYAINNDNVESHF